MRTRWCGAIAGAAALIMSAGPGAAGAEAAKKLSVSEFRLPPAKLDTLRDRFISRTLKRHRPGTWAPLRMDLTNRDLALMGLPSRKVLTAQRYRKPTVFDAKGRPQTLQTGVLSFAGTGYFGIRPGAWILLIDDKGVGWCSAAHVYGTPGSYDISTAGHCGRPGDVATVIGVVGDRLPVLIDFGKFATSRDNGLGDDWALIDIYDRWQNLVTPTMAFWGGPFGVFTKQGAVAGVNFPRNGWVPQVSVNPDPFLAQEIVHYGHGVGVGAGGTPRTATAVAWGDKHFMFFGAISPGDSGSGSNTLLGDSVGAQREAAGINTHLYVDPLMRQGLGIMGGTRTTAVKGIPANGQLVGYPAPVPGAP